MVKNLPAIQEMQIRSLGQEDPLEKGTATHSSILAWRIPSWRAKVYGVAKSQDITERLTLSDLEQGSSYFQINGSSTLLLYLSLVLQLLVFILIKRGYFCNCCCLSLVPQGWFLCKPVQVKTLKISLQNNKSLYNTTCFLAKN